MTRAGYSVFAAPLRVRFCNARAILGLPVDVSLRRPGASAVIYGGRDEAANRIRRCRPCAARTRERSAAIRQARIVHTPSHGRRAGQRRRHRRSSSARERVRVARETGRDLGRHGAAAGGVDGCGAVTSAGGCGWGAARLPPPAGVDGCGAVTSRRRVWTVGRCGTSAGGCGWVRRGYPPPAGVDGETVRHLRRRGCGWVRGAVTSAGGLWMGAARLAPPAVVDGCGAVGSAGWCGWVRRG